MKNALKKQPKTEQKTADDHGVDTLLLEIREEIKRDEMIKLIKKHSGLAIALTILLVVGVAAFQIYKHYDDKATQQAGAQLLAALEADEPNFSAFEKAAKNRHYSDLATISKANSLLKNGDTQKALKTYEQVAKNGKEKIFRDLATLNVANLLLNQDAKNEKIEQKLKSLIDSKSHFSYSAKDLLAVYYVQNENYDAARKLLKELAKDANAPVTISHRAKQMLTTI